MKKITKFKNLYLKFINGDKKNNATITIKLENPITYNQFFNLNFNIHHLNMKYYRIFHQESMRNKYYKQMYLQFGWIILDKEVNDEEHSLMDVTINYKILSETIRRIKFELNKNIQIFTSKKIKIEMLDLQKEFIESLLILEPQYFIRTSLKQINRTFNQDKKISEVSIIANPMTIESINCCFNLFKNYLFKYSKEHNFNEWFGNQVLNAYSEKINPSTKKQNESYIEQQSENCAIQIESEILIDDDVFQELDFWLTTNQIR
jgi:hypothetical protein